MDGSPGKKMTKDAKIPRPTIERLALYSRPLETLQESGTPVVSSERLAALCGVNSAQVRKDLAYFGEFGVRGVGYDVNDLLRGIKAVLGTDREWTLCIVGMGNMGEALVDNDNFKKRGYRFIAAFDSDPDKIARKFPCGLTVQPVHQLRETVQKQRIEIGVITTPPHSAQRVADLLMDAGVKAIMNFSPIQVRGRDCCTVENVDFTVKLENLAYHLAQKKLRDREN
jgi:redox-sensing transcriptional repressor